MSIDHHVPILGTRDDEVRVQGRKTKTDFDGNFDFDKVKYLRNNACPWKGAQRQGNQGDAEEFTNQVRAIFTVYLFFYNL